MNIPESNLRNMLSSISELNHVLNETLILTKNTSTDCSDCGYDPIRRESTNPYCEKCNGTGEIITQIKYEIPSSVETEQDFEFEYGKTGRVTNGEILATIDSKEISEILNVDKSFNMDNQKDIKKFLDQFTTYEWKGANYSLKSFQPGYLQGRFYEIQVKLGLKG